ncbi:MAG: uncharacterized protein PWQ23_1623 [Thermoanaerobacter sp.]|jgi:hypothetical protein|nr:uncharacterized protein [Thermoanaerobacter sp.]
MNIENVLELLELRMKRSISFLPAKRRLYFEELKKVRSYSSFNILMLLFTLFIKRKL